MSRMKEYYTKLEEVGLLPDFPSAVEAKPKRISCKECKRRFIPEKSYWRLCPECAVQTFNRPSYTSVDLPNFGLWEETYDDDNYNFS